MTKNENLVIPGGKKSSEVFVNNSSLFGTVIQNSTLKIYLHPDCEENAVYSSVCVCKF